MTRLLDPVAERLSGRHLLGCPLWQATGLVEQQVCTCPDSGGGEDGGALLAELAADLPMNAAGVQARLVELAVHGPEWAACVRDGLLRHVLHRIADDRIPGRDARVLAKAALVACGAQRGAGS